MLCKLRILDHEKRSSLKGFHKSVPGPVWQVKTTI